MVRRAEDCLTTVTRGSVMQLLSMMMVASWSCFATSKTGALHKVVAKKNHKVKTVEMWTQLGAPTEIYLMSTNSPRKLIKYPARIPDVPKAC